MNQTAITYPIAVINQMSGEQIKLLLEHIADNSFHPDPYKQQGGDMVRVGQLRYVIRPFERFKKRISNLTLNGKPLDANKTYRVVSWGDVSRPMEGLPVWDVLANYLKGKNHIKIDTINVPKVIS